MYYKYYNSDSIDLVPWIMSQALSMNICIYNNIAGTMNLHALKCNNSSSVCKTVYLSRQGDHYNAIVPRNSLNHSHSLDPYTASSSIISASNNNATNNKSVSGPGQVQDHNQNNSAHNKLKKLVQTHKGFGYTQSNVRSLIPKIEEIRHILSTSQIHAHCVCETWLDDSISDAEINVPGYKVERKDRNREGGGVLIYIREDVKYKLRKDIAQKAPTVENIWIEISGSKAAGDNVLLGCMYRPPSSNHDYFNGMLDIIEFASFQEKKVELAGDINFNYVFDESLSSNPISYIEQLYGLTQIVDKPTRVTDKTSSLLDIILTSDPMDHTHTEVLPFTFSDHYIVYTCLNVVPKYGKHRTVTYRCYKQFDPSLFLDDLYDADIFKDSSYSKFDGVEDLWSSWKTKFLDISNKHAPIRTCRLKNRRNPWITAEIVKLMYERDFIQQKAIKYNCPILFDEYRRLRNLVTYSIDLNKRNYYTKLASDKSIDSKTLWKELGRITGNSKQDNSMPSDMDCNEFNDFFTGIGPSLQKTLPDPGPLIWKNPECTYNFEFDKITHESILKRLKKLSKDSHLDILTLDAKLLNIGSEVLAPSITYIMNLSIETNIIPIDWKLARVTCIYKNKGSKHDMSNYRPISILPILSMMMEREIQTQLVDYFVEHDLINIDQFAFLKHHSTVTCLHRLLDDWYEAINEGEFVFSSFFDIKKCFDMIDHKLLLEKMSKYGICNDTLSWFSNYLSNRSQVVHCNGETSERKEVSLRAQH